MKTNLFQEIGSLLQEGQIAIIGSDYAVYIPPGWINFVYTLVGGYIIRHSFSTREDLPISLACAEEELKVVTNPKSLEIQITTLASTICRSFSSTNEITVRSAAATWIRLVAAIRLATNTKELVWGAVVRSHMAALLRNVARDCRIDLPGDCPCGELGSGGKDFYQHFTAHVPLLAKS